LVSTLTPTARAATVKGTVIVPPEPHPSDAQAHWRVENGVLPVVPRGLDVRGEVVVVLDPEGAPKLPEPAPTVTLELHGLRLDPRAIAVPVGATVEFKNSDRVSHTLYAERLPTLMPPEPTAPGQVRAQRFLAPGEYRILDEEYPHIAGTVVVVDTPYVAAVDERGAFRIEVPEGRYTLRAFCRGAWMASRPLEVGPHTPDVVLHPAARAEGGAR
jgi:hypothetical protein